MSFSSIRIADGAAPLSTQEKVRAILEELQNDEIVRAQLIEMLEISDVRLHSALLGRFTVTEQADTCVPGSRGSGPESELPPSLQFLMEGLDEREGKDCLQPAEAEVQKKKGKKKEKKEKKQKEKKKAKKKDGTCKKDTTPSVGEVVYQAPESSWLETALAVLSLKVAFAAAAFAPILLVIGLYFAALGSATILAVLVVVMSTVLHKPSRWDWVRQAPVFHWWRSYFNLRVVKQGNLPSDKRGLLFAVFPHGVFPLSLLLLSGVQDEVFPEWRGNSAPVVAGVASVFFRLPLLSSLFRWLGCVPADRLALEQALANGSCFLFPEGVAGVFHSSRKKEKIYLKKRKGFVRLALQAGHSLVPVYAFGQTQLHSVCPGPECFLARWSRRLRVALIFFFGRLFSPLPHHHPITIAIGQPVGLPLCPAPSQDDVDAAHAKFAASLENLFEDCKSLAPGYAKKSLKIV